jgi:hypothetical protein
VEIPPHFSPIASFKKNKYFHMN